MPIHIQLTPTKPTNDGVIQKLYSNLREDARRSAMSKGEMGITFVETAGGVLSPGPSGTPQADIFRPMRLPVLLVGDHRLGGISSTISAAESLTMRGYDIDAVVCFDDQGKYENSAYLKEHFEKMDIAAFEIPWIPNLDGCNEKEEGERMLAYYEHQSGAGDTYNLSGRLIDQHFSRLENMKSMASRTNKAIWHPFTQHKSVEKADDILVFDSAYGDYFQAKHTAKSIENVESKADAPILRPAFDASASWWTQGLGHGNPQLSLAAAYAAGRYGHIMFAGATHDPALTLAERLLSGLQNPRLKKVFYTDDGSTAVEVGIKMALRAACKKYHWDGATENIGVIGLKGSYHGDTIGAMDASEPNVYNEKVDWYRGRGYWFDFPTVKMVKGKWIIEPPAGMEEEFGPTQHYDDISQIFDVIGRGHSPRYEQYIRGVLDKLVKEEGRKFGALVMEPIILGAGGMLFVDPLFQRTLVRVVRNYDFTKSASTANQEGSPSAIPGKSNTVAEATTWAGLPVLFDEVFTGLYRLGRFTSSSLLAVHPDISCHAKLLTGGLLPLSVTVASDSIYQAFWGDSKAEALLHGHSYTAHPIGCHIANISLEEMGKLSRGSTWATYQESWAKPSQQSQSRSSTALSTESSIWSMWSKPTIVSLSHHASVDSVVALGSVLAVNLKDESGAGGYTSNAAAGLRDALLNEVDENEVAIHSRVLGNVIYFMVSMTTEVSQLKEVEESILRTLDKVS
jgi:dethiobiotin synthetase/adenosylmethionine--8-amino-7-oxononanoate aminotransferase